MICICAKKDIRHVCTSVSSDMHRPHCTAIPGRISISNEEFRQARRHGHQRTHHNSKWSWFETRWTTISGCVVDFVLCRELSAAERLLLGNLSWSLNDILHSCRWYRWLSWFLHPWLMVNSWSIMKKWSRNYHRSIINAINKPSWFLAQWWLIDA